MAPAASADGQDDATAFRLDPRDDQSDLGVEQPFIVHVTDARDLLFQHMQVREDGIYPLRPGMSPEIDALLPLEVVPILAALPSWEPTQRRGGGKPLGALALKIVARANLVFTRHVVFPSSKQSDNPRCIAVQLAHDI